MQIDPTGYYSERAKLLLTDTATLDRLTFL